MSIRQVWLENRRGVSGLGIDEERPRISFISDEAVAEVVLQFAWDDGSVERAIGHGSRLLAWPFRPLGPRAGGYLSIQVAGEGSDEFRVEAGLHDEWDVDFASPSLQASTQAPRPAYLMRAVVDLDSMGIAAADVRQARLYATAHGLYDLEVNGARVGDDRLSPGWTSYPHRLRYQTHDLTPQLAGGTAVVGAWLADGWYRGHIGFDGGLWNVYGTDVALLAQLEVTTSKGRVAVPLTWQWLESPITAVGLYEGETYDARRLPAGWSSPGFVDLADWQDALLLDRTGFLARIGAPTGPAVRETEVRAPVSVDHTPDGRIRLDFGQNISGVLRIRPKGRRGDRIELHHAEVLEGGRLGVRPLRAATSVDTYVCASSEREEYSPRFTIHGFRYAELAGWPGEFSAADVEALVIHTDMQRTGWFECSNQLLNQLHSNVVWSMRDNFVDLPTDCPQRDERMGWTGDIQVFAPTALRLFAVQGTLTGWLRDLAAEQAVRGHVPNFVPWVACGFPDFPTAAWGDAAVIVPWELYRCDGDPKILRDQYPSMRAWVDLVAELTNGTGLWNRGFQLGDWLDPAAPPEEPGKSHTDKSLVASAYHVRTARILAEVAGILDQPEDREHYLTLANRATSAFQAEFITPSGRVVSDTVTALSLAIEFDLFASQAQRARAGARLRELVLEAGFHISTGFVGTPIVCDALASIGSIDYAYHLLLQQELPSWLYPVTMGATTIWERWDSMLPDGSINPGDMTSFNHYALGAVASFLHEHVAGLAAPGPGWERIRFAPKPGGGLTHASARYESVNGTTSIDWFRDGETFTVTVVVPPAATGTVELPCGGEAVSVGPGTHTFSAQYRAAADDPAAPVLNWRDLFTTEAGNQ